MFQNLNNSPYSQDNEPFDYETKHDQKLPILPIITIVIMIVVIVSIIIL